MVCWILCISFTLKITNSEILKTVFSILLAEYELLHQKPRYKYGNGHCICGQSSWNAALMWNMVMTLVLAATLYAIMIIDNVLYNILDKFHEILF